MHFIQEYLCIGLPATAAASVVDDSSDQLWFGWNRCNLSFLPSFLQRMRPPSVYSHVMDSECHERMHQERFTALCRALRSAGLANWVALTCEQGLHFVDHRRRQPAPAVAAPVRRWQEPIKGSQPLQGAHQQFVCFFPAARASCPSCTRA